MLPSVSVSGVTWIDSHCHLDRYTSLTPVLTAAAQAGVSHILSICVSEENFSLVYPLAQQHPGVLASVGIHPCEPHNPCATFDHVVAWLLQSAALPKVVALGETGLDFYKDAPCADYQHMIFRAHLHVARITGLPLVVHMRNSEDAFVQLMEEELRQGPIQGVMHCFTGSPACAQRVLSWGWYISLSGIVTFPNARALQELVPQIPLSHLLVETDAPWLAPQSHRGQQNQPAYVAETGTYAAALHNMDVPTFARAVEENFFRLFTKAQRLRGEKIGDKTTGQPQTPHLG